MNFRAIIAGAIQLLVISLLVLGLLLWAGVEVATGPQVLTLSAIGIWPGLYSGMRTTDGGILHGMLAGLSGALLLVITIILFSQFAELPQLITQLAAKRYLLIALLGGLWGGIGGLFADIMRVRRLKKASRADPQVPKQ